MRREDGASCTEAGNGRAERANEAVGDREGGTDGEIIGGDRDEKI